MDTVTESAMAISMSKLGGLGIVHRYNTISTQVGIIRKIRAEVETFMDEGLLLLTPDLVKTMMENIIREHLGWLVVWGNVFGGLIGVICLASGLRLGQP